MIFLLKRSTSAAKELILDIIKVRTTLKALNTYIIVCLCVCVCVCILCVYMCVCEYVYVDFLLKRSTVAAKVLILDIIKVRKYMYLVNTLHMKTKNNK